ncbi:hypothetical protein CXL00_22920 [Stutzerimonas stutzeri]|jgi:hypothetical protein|uniref:Uncharacterized protein n=1 Tax=Stutzerimonas stutzeri TaxID=316 RepID=A0A2N8SKL2_STUST|nr:hypothetical protein CXL00_22920 [Stutzerimonas stutzeri]
MQTTDRPRFRVSADRQSGSRRVRYVETNRPDSQSCTICQLDEENPSPIEVSSSAQNADEQEPGAKPERSR